MAATDAKAIPIKNAAYRVTFPILDADGDLVTGATALDSEVSIDAGTFADCTNEATEIATGSGVYFLDLTAAEMNGDTIAVIVKTTSAGAKTTTLVMYTAVRSIDDLAYPTTSGRSIDVTATGGVGIDWANVENPTTALNLSATNIDVDQVVASVSGAVGSVTGLTASNLDAAISTRATPAQILTTALTESYAADSAAPTVAQALFQLLGREYEFAITGDTMTVKKLDGLTTAMTFTLAPAGGPYNSITRAT